MNTFDITHYGLVFQPLIAGDRRRALDRGAPDFELRPALEKLSISTAFEHNSSHRGGRQIADADMAACCIAGVWLLHDFLDESHTISQCIDTAEGSYWHAIMHRREGDFSNSKYWYRQAGNHPIFESLAEQVGMMSDANSSFTESSSGGWDPYSFVDACQAAVRGKSDDRDNCLDIQQAEWELLFDYCYCQAIGD